MAHLLGEGPRYLRDRDLTTQSDLDYTEAEGRLDGADPDSVSDHALNRGAEQCGTLGSGNHFMEVQIVDEVFDEKTAAVFGLEKDMVCVMIHSGSRGWAIKSVTTLCCRCASRRESMASNYLTVSLPAPGGQPRREEVHRGHARAANFAWCNRQLLMQQARDVFATVFGQSWQELQMNLVYDVCHNIAKLEEHSIGGKLKKVWVHRKGATPRLSGRSP